jgi:hypothetical protein
VVIVTLGRRDLVNIFPYSDHPCVQKLAAAQDFDVECRNVRAALLEAVLPADSLLFCYKVTQFFIEVSQRGPQSWGHSGLHWENARAMLNHHGGTTMKRLAKGISTRLAENRAAPMIYLALCCNQGRDRSVACSVVLENALKISGFDVTTRHLCQSTWRRNTGCQDAAESVCNPRQPNKQCPDCQVGCSEYLVMDAIQNNWIPELDFSRA